MTTKNLTQENDKEDEISLKLIILQVKYWWRFLLSKGLPIFLGALLFGSIGFGYAYLKKPIYIATTTFVLEDGDKQGGLGGLGGLASMAGIEIGGAGGLFQGDNIIELYKSRTMIEKSLFSPLPSDSSKLIIDKFIEFNDLRKKWAENPALNGIQFGDNAVKDNKTNRLRDSLLGFIVEDINKNYLSVEKPDKKLNIIKAEVKSSNELFSEAFNNAIVANVNEFYIDTKTKKSIQNIKILEEKRDSVNRVMNGAIYSSANVLDATPNLNPTRLSQRVAPVQKAEFLAETNKTILASLVQNLELSKMSLLKETPLIQVIDGPVFPLKIERMGMLKSLVIGGLLGAFLVCAYLIIKRIIKQITSNES
jgi:hypothetical protein